MGQAISYALNQWPMLERFLEHGEVELDNNLVENAIRPAAIGKKNWFFFGSAEAGQRSVVMYTLIENCRMHGVEPYTYLKRRAGAPAHHDQPRSRPTDAAALEGHPTVSAPTGCLKFLRHPANRSSYHDPRVRTVGRYLTAYRSDLDWNFTCLPRR